MSIFRGDASEVYRLAGDLSQVGAKAVPALRGTMAAAGEAFAARWSANAREHFRADGHAYGYPDSIDSELVFNLSGVSVDVGPNAAKKHGFLGRVLEMGGERSPAYLDGLRALDLASQSAEKMVGETVERLLP